MSKNSIKVHAASAAYEAARRSAALVDRSHRGRLIVSGTDRATYLQGLLTNDISALGAGQGCYSAYLTAQGRMIADMFVYELGDAMLMSLVADVKDAVLARLDQFVFAEDVSLADATASRVQIGIVGPQAAEVTARVLNGVAHHVLAAVPEHASLRVEWCGTTAIVTRTSDVGVPGFDVYVDASCADELRAALTGTGAPFLDEAASEALRIEAGVPLFHRDMDEETIPLEAGIESRAISFTKGCYVGQEVIVRVLHRGHGRVARRLVGLRVDGEGVPPAGAVVRAADKDVGQVTSSTWSAVLGAAIALGYVQRDFVEPGTAVVVDGADARVAALPFVGTS